VVRSRRDGARPSVPGKSMPRPRMRDGPAGAAGKQTAPTKASNAALRRGLARGLAQHPRPHEGQGIVTGLWRFAGGKPGLCRHRQVRRGARSHRHDPPAGETPATDQPPPWGIGRDAGATLRDAIQPLRLALESLRGREGLSFRRAARRTRFQPSGLVWDGLEGVKRPSISMRQASTELAIG